MSIKKVAFNPYLPSYEYVPDGEPRVFGDRLYVYGSHDKFNGDGFCLGDYVCWSAPLDDLSDFRNEGTIYRASQDPANTQNDMHMNAPDCVQGPDGRYYLYYAMHTLTCAAVAVSESPAGPFEYYGTVNWPDGTPYGNKPGDTYAFDPGVFVDDDKRVYCYLGFAPTGNFKKFMEMRGNRVESAVCLELAADMKTIIGKEKDIVPGPLISEGTGYEGHAFFEASSMRKIGDTYYFVYSSELSHELCYATSKYPDRGFKYGGTLVSIMDIGYKGNEIPDNYGGNTHGGMVCIKGQWYIFYHRQTNLQNCARQGCAEKIYINEDGSIEQAELTSCGLNDGPLPTIGKYEARIACNLASKSGTFSAGCPHDTENGKGHPYFTQSGQDREDNPDQYIANLMDGAYAGFKYFGFTGNESELKVEYRGNAVGEFQVSFEKDGDIVARLPIIESEEWTVVSCTLMADCGNKALFFKFVGTGSIDFNSFELK